MLPDILLLGKALGGGMPLGAFVASSKLMSTLSYSPMLGHLTTFGGHPVCCAAGLAAANVLLQEKLMDDVAIKEALFIKNLQHPKIRNVSSAGLWLAVELDSFETTQAVISYCLVNGVFTDWFLYASNCVRIAPPLTITEADIEQSCRVLVNALHAI